MNQRFSLTLTAALALCLSACANYVKRDEFDAAMSELRGADSAQREEMAQLRTRFGELTDDLAEKFEDYNARITELSGRLRVDMTAHFAYDDATLREQDKEALGAFAEVIRDHHPNVLVTVEGFTDSAGDADYNEWLGMERAKAARAYLVSQGLAADRVRAVSYGEDSNRQVSPGEWGDAGAANRRVALVVDHVPG
ncbi:MAG: OmpA family protein [Pseudomonadota bacterium]